MSKTRKPIPKPDWAKDRWANPPGPAKEEEKKPVEAPEKGPVTDDTPPKTEKE